MLPDTTGRFGLIQIFDWDGFPSHPAMTTSQIQAEAPYEDTVWGAFNPQAWDSAHPGMYVSRYMLPVEDNNSVSGHDLSWWQSNHPDWILYACNTSDGSPTKDLSWGTSGFPDVPLNFANAQVVQYQISMMIKYAQANGYNTIAVDNTDLFNYTYGSNNYGVNVDYNEYGCGYYDTSGAFHRVFGSGRANNPDPAFISAMVQWLQTASQMLHSAGLKLIVNHPLYNHPTNSNEQAILDVVDGIVMENGFTYYGDYYSDPAAQFSTAVPWAEAAQQHHVAFLITDYLCHGGKEDFNGGAPCPSDPLQIPAPQVDYALATYALVNEGGVDVYISPKTGASPSYRPEYSTRYGAPCGAYTQSGSVYMRRFQGGLAVVNASTSPVSFTLPHAASSYQDIEKRAISNPLNLGAADGYFLLTTNGCS